MKYIGKLSAIPTSILLLLLITAVIAPISQLVDIYYDGKELLRATKDGLAYLLFSVATIKLYARDPSQFQAWLRQPITVAAVAFIGLNIVYFFVSDASLQTRYAGLLFNTRFIIWFLLLQLVALYYPKIRDEYKNIIILLSWFLVLYTLVQVLVLPPDFFGFLGYEYPSGLPYQTVDNDPNLPRYAATTRGPNELAAFLLVSLSVVAGYVMKRRHYMSKQTLLFGLGLAALFFTYSRSAQLGLAVSLGILSLIYVKNKKYWLLGLAGLAVIVMGLVGLSSQSQLGQRILFHDENNSQEIDSNDQRLVQLERTTEMVADRPFGYGVGSAGPASFYGDDPFIPDNYYGQLAVELGVVGLLLFTGFYTYILRELFYKSPVAFASGIGLLIVGLFAHVWVDDLTAYTWWGLAAIALSQKTRALLSSRT